MPEVVAQDVVPLIYTSRGNVPIASLRYVNRREDVPGTVVFIEEWFAADGERVKRSVHVLPLVGLVAAAERGELG